MGAAVALLAALLAANSTPIQRIAATHASFRYFPALILSPQAQGRHLPGAVPASGLSIPAALEARP